mmetsp:Transcript_81840/g.236554  ORF Transcript_81840/g.236554 Transcript_81840/m.236554 type:complete len:207 (+) Transcript_81840:498-1118(+)
MLPGGLGNQLLDRLQDRADLPQGVEGLVFWRILEPRLRFDRDPRKRLAVFGGKLRRRDPEATHVDILPPDQELLQEVLEVLVVERHVRHVHLLLHLLGDAVRAVATRAEYPLDELLELDAAVLVGVGHEHDLANILVRPDLRVQVLQHSGQLRTVDDAVTVEVEPGELVDNFMLRFRLLGVLAVLRRAQHGPHDFLDLRFADDCVR